jgi:hypothetical protein
MKAFTRKAAIAGASVAFVALSAILLVQPMRSALSQQPPMMEHMMFNHDQMPEMMQMHGQPMMQVHGSGMEHMSMNLTPTLSGQDAFGAVQEIVRMLEADPNTDWSKIDLEALRQHLIDMNDVTLRADALAKDVDGGLEIAITGTGRILSAIQRMLPAHAQELGQINGWAAKTEALPNGVLLTIKSSDPQQVAKIRGLGFIGLLVSGSHHQPHHLAMAKQEMLH